MGPNYKNRIKQVKCQPLSTNMTFVVPLLKSLRLMLTTIQGVSAVSTCRAPQTKKEQKSGSSRAVSCLETYSHGLQCVNNTPGLHRIVKLSWGD